ncbi:hypothetical protein I552_6924 [Mycobacterium xenopi 3993]|nr:hypothetical protein I552_6924 [Mycobacterium xenopi 3993]
MSADGYFAGSPRGLLRCWRWRYAVWFGFRPGRRRAGLLFGWALFLNYGLALMALPALAVLACADDWRRSLRALGPVVLAAVTVMMVFAGAGYWWFDGYTLVQQRYWQGIAHDRPFQYWAGLIWPRWCVRSGWAASRALADCSTATPSGSAQVCTCCCWPW